MVQFRKDRFGLLTYDAIRLTSAENLRESTTLVNRLDDVVCRTRLRTKLYAI